ncbi:hypothetical protein [Dickeya oryzae]|uniref:hypothetical protein n=1 Tax=Dickeya oryzae TaxID=1240404 RepID=UPI001296DC7E|nr:hypothetical protein [Dickeya oryzae]
MKNNFFEPLILNDIPFNFAVILPVNGRDTLCIYNDRKFGLKAYGYFQSNGQENNKYSPSTIISSSFGIKSNEKEIHFIFSEDTYPDINNRDERSSHIVFAWEGLSNKYNHEKISSIFSSYEKYIYDNFRKWIDIKGEESEINNGDISLNINYNDMENIERNIEERVSIIVYQAERTSSLIVNKNKKTRQVLLVFSFIYLIVITLLFFTKFIF